MLAPTSNFTSYLRDLSITTKNLHKATFSFFSLSITSYPRKEFSATNYVFIGVFIGAFVNVFIDVI